MHLRQTIDISYQPQYFDAQVWQYERGADEVDAQVSGARRPRHPNGGRSREALVQLELWLKAGRAHASCDTLRAPCWQDGRFYATRAASPQLRLAIVMPDV